jgi:hypothetical protein
MYDVAQSHLIYTLSHQSTHQHSVFVERVHAATRAAGIGDDAAIVRLGDEAPQSWLSSSL